MRTDAVILLAAAQQLADYAMLIRQAALVDGQWDSEQVRVKYADVMMRHLQLRQLAENNAPYEYPLPPKRITYAPTIEYKHLRSGRPRKDTSTE